MQGRKLYFLPFKLFIKHSKGCLRTCHPHSQCFYSLIMCQVRGSWPLPPWVHKTESGRYHPAVGTRGPPLGVVGVVAECPVSPRRLPFLLSQTSHLAQWDDNELSFPFHPREEIQTLTKKFQELEGNKKEEKDEPMELSPEVWLSRGPCSGGWGPQLTLAVLTLPGFPASNSDKPIPFIVIITSCDVYTEPWSSGQ